MGKKVMNLKESMEGYMAWSRMMKGKGEIIQLHNIKCFLKSSLGYVYLLILSSFTVFPTIFNRHKTQENRIPDF